MMRVIKNVAAMKALALSALLATSSFLTGTAVEAAGLALLDKNGSIVNPSNVTQETVSSLYTDNGNGTFTYNYALISSTGALFSVTDITEAVAFVNVSALGVISTSSNLNLSSAFGVGSQNIFDGTSIGVSALNLSLALGVLTTPSFVGTGTTATTASFRFGTPPSFLATDVAVSASVNLNRTTGIGIFSITSTSNKVNTINYNFNNIVYASAGLIPTSNCSTGSNLIGIGVLANCSSTVLGPSQTNANFAAVPEPEILPGLLGILPMLIGGVALKRRRQQAEEA